MYLLYSVLYGCLLVLATPYFLYRSLREPGFGASLVERWGRVRLNPGRARSIWIHAVSVGEVMAAGTLLPAFQRAFPEARLTLSVTTPTGRRVAEERLEGLDDLFYCPFDLGFIVRRVVRQVNPIALIVIETEIWPNLFREARRAGAVSLLANGRISDRSYPRYRLIRPFLRRYLREVDRFLMQSAVYARRIEDLGAPREQVEVAGSLKFDAPPAPAHGSITTLVPGGRKVLVGGSTLEPEERILLDVFSRLRSSVPGLFLVLAPRHPKRFDEVFALARARGFRVSRRSRIDSPDAASDVLVLDTLGELPSLYSAADFVFVGGSLADWGGHNIIEPATLGKPVLFGPHMQNFADVARIFLEAGAAIQVKSASELEEALRDLASRPERCRELGQSSRRVIEANRGATGRSVAALKELLS